MKKIILLFTLMALIIPAWLSAGVTGPARISLVDGEVMFRTPVSGEWLTASINTPIDEGDALWCPDGSRAEIQLSDGAVVRLDGGSQLDLIAYDESFTHLHLASGRLYLKTAQTSGKNSLQIDADDTTVLPDARTRLRIDMLPNSQEDVAIFMGSAYVEGGASLTQVRTGDHIALEVGQSELLPLNPPDSWENWNTERDRSQSRSAKTDSYLPDELRGHSPELDSNGTWVRVSEYGMVWKPNLIVSDDWAPYRSGRWIWRDNDYVWISQESWGWVPYHYGRWALVSGFGWCWVPPLRGDVFWGPGYVGWYSTGTHIGWTPLAPGEIFYGYGRYGRHSVNITSRTINTSAVVYRNRNIRGGLTVVPQNDFLRGRIAPQQPSGSRPVSVSVSVGSPRIQPQRETRMPIVRETTPQTTPPKIYHQDSRELRQRFQRLTPQSDMQLRYQKPEHLMPAGSVPAIQAAPVKEKRTAYPSVTAETKPVTREPKQKKVWKITTPEEGKERVNREKEPKGRENKNR
jgi:hypothetical protein